MAQHTLMILGSMDEFVRLAEMSKARGYRTIVCDGYPQGPAKRIADVALNIDVRDTQAVAAACKEYGADGIISSFSDVLGECLINIAEAASLPSYAKPEAFRFLREKSLMKQMFAELGVPTPKSALVHKETVHADLEGLAFPCVMKPMNGWGSRGVFVVNNEEELADLFEETISHSVFDYCMVEEYSRGYEINMMTWIVNGEPIIVSMADREKSQEVAGAIPHVSRIVYPSVFTADAYEQALEIVRKIAGYVGIETGPLCVQFFWDYEKGISVCEAAGRIFGYEHELLDLAGGPLVEDLLLDYVYARDRLVETLRTHSCQLPGQACGLYFHAYEGVVGDTSVLDALKTEVPEVVETLVYYRPGDVVSHMEGAKPYAARYYLQGESRDQLDKATCVLYDRARLFDDKGDDMLYASTIAEYPQITT